MAADRDRRGPEYVHPEAALGGADAVEKTSYVVGESAEPEGTNPPGGVVARVAPGRGVSPVALVVLALALLVALLYGMGLFA